MPVDFKLRSLRRAFGEPSFLKRLDTKTSAKVSLRSRARKAEAEASGARDSSENAGNDFPGRPQGGRNEMTDPSRNKPKPMGGLPRLFYDEQPPRSIRNKSVASQMYTVHLLEKQKMKIYYGAMSDTKFRHYVMQAKAKRFNTDAALLRLLELRLDTVLYRTGFVKTPMQARQWIFHHQIEVNGRITDAKSCALTPGDVIGVRDRFMPHAFLAQAEAADMRKLYGVGASWLVGRSDDAGMVPWMEIDRIGLSAALVRNPTTAEMRCLQRATLFPYIRDANMNPHAAMRSYR